MARETNERRRALEGGIVAGLLGGVALAVLLLLVNIASGSSPWVPFKVAALPFLGERVLQPGFELGPVLLGVVTHFAVSIVWGALFGLIAYGASRGATLGLGVLWGVIVWLVMYYVVLPLVGSGALVRGVPVGLALFDHLVFGLFVGVGFLPYQRPGQRPRPKEPVQRPTRGGRDLEGPRSQP